jgi:recombination protein RecT
VNQQIQRVDEKQTAMRAMLTGNSIKKRMAEILPEYMSAERMTRVAVTAMTKNPKLYNCSPESVLIAMIDLSTLGLEPDGRRAALVPYKSECKLMVMYQGLVQLIMDTGIVSRIHADVVREKDVFTEDKGIVTEHKIDRREDRGEVYAAWCVIELKDGSAKYEVMSRDEIEAVRSMSKSRDSDAWTQSGPEMAKKTVFRRAAKWIPWQSKNATNHEAVSRALQLDDQQFESMDTPPATQATGLDAVTLEMQEKQSDGQ